MQENSIFYELVDVALHIETDVAVAKSQIFKEIPCRQSKKLLAQRCQLSGLCVPETRFAMRGDC